MLTLNALSARNGNFRLGPISFELDGGYVVLAGHNGAGKSTLMRCITGLQRGIGGEVRVNGHDVASGHGRRGVAAMTGYSPQNAQLPGRATVADVLCFAAWLKGLNRHDSVAAAELVASRLNLSQVVRTPCGKLSGGTRQRVVIGQALVHDPRLLVLDEPSAGMDPVQRVSLRELLCEIATERTVLVSTHLVEDVEAAADRVIVLRRGELAFDGTAGELGQHGTLAAHGDTALERGLWQLLSEDAS